MAACGQYRSTSRLLFCKFRLVRGNAKRSPHWNAAVVIMERAHDRIWAFFGLGGRKNESVSLLLVLHRAVTRLGRCSFNGLAGKRGVESGGDEVLRFRDDFGIRDMR